MVESIEGRWKANDGEEDLGFITVAKDGAITFIGAPSGENFRLVALESGPGCASRFAIQAEDGEQVDCLVCESTERLRVEGGTEVWVKFTGVPPINSVANRRQFTKEPSHVLAQETIEASALEPMQVGAPEQDLKALVHRILQDTAISHPDGEYWSRLQFVRFFRRLDPNICPENVDMMLAAAFPASRDEPVELFLVDRFFDWLQGDKFGHTSRRASLNAHARMASNTSLEVRD